MSVALSVTANFKSILLFCFSIESSHFLAVSSPCGTLQTLFLDFWFRPPNAQNLLPKIFTKTPISRLVWQIDWRCFGLLGGFWWWPIQWNHAKCSVADPCYHGNKLWARHGVQSPTGLLLLYCHCSGWSHYNRMFGDFRALLCSSKWQYYWCIITVWRVSHNNVYIWWHVETCYIWWDIGTCCLVQ